MTYFSAHRTFKLHHFLKKLGNRTFITQITPLSFFEQLSDYSEEDSAESAQAVATESTTEY